MSNSLISTSQAIQELEDLPFASLLRLAVALGRPRRGDLAQVIWRRSITAHEKVKREARDELIEAGYQPVADYPLVLGPEPITLKVEILRDILEWLIAGRIFPLERVVSLERIVRVFYKNTLRRAFQADDPIDPADYVQALSLPRQSLGIRTADEVFRLLNMDRAPRPRNIRSLSVGDVVQVDERFSLCENLGWRDLSPLEKTGLDIVTGFSFNRPQHLSAAVLQTARLA